MALSQSIRQAFTNMAWLMLGKVLAYASTGIASIIVARELGPEKIGLIAYTMSIVAFADSVAFLGMDPILFKHFTRRPRGALTLLRTSMQLRFAAASLCYLLLGVLVWISYASGQIDAPLLLVGALLLFTHYGYLVAFWFHSRVEASKVIRWEILGAFVSAVLRIGAVLSGYEVYTIVGILVVSQLIESLGITWSLLHDPQFRQQTSKALRLRSLQTYSQWAKQRFNRNASLLLGHGWPFLFASMAHFIYMRIDQVMLPLLHSRKETGYYAAAAILAEMPYLMSIMIAHSVFPGLIKLQRINIELYHHRMVQFFSAMIWTSIVITLCLWFAGPFLIDLLYGRAFEPSSIMFQTLILGLPFMFCSSIIGTWVLANNLQKQYSLMLAIAALLNIVLNVILIPHWGGMGASIASVLAYIVVGMGGMFVFKTFRTARRYLVNGLKYPVTIVTKII